MCISVLLIIVCISVLLIIVCISVLRGEYSFSGGYEAGGVVRFSGACGARFLEKVLPI